MVLGQQERELCDNENLIKKKEDVSKHKDDVDKQKGRLQSEMLSIVLILNL